MKKNTNVKGLRIVALLLACALLLLSSCSAVFDSAISGTVKDISARETSSTTSGGIADSMVYAYDNASAWNNAYNKWDGKSIFTDLSVPSAKTASDGSFSISSLRWKTNNPVYGKDADSRTIYLLIFNKDYGLTKVDGRTVQSDKSNNFGIVYCNKVSTSKNLVVKLKDIEDNSTTATGSDSTISDTSGFSFRYSYCDGYSSDGSDNVFATVSSITNGQATITVKYKQTNDDGTVATPPTVTVYDIQTGDDWSYSGSESVKMNYSGKAYTNNSLYFSNDWKNVTITVNLKDGATNSSITDPITFKWEYNNGDGDTVKSDTTGPITTGTITLNVKYKKDSNPVLKLTKFDDQEGGEDYWTWTEDKDNAATRADDSCIEIALTNDSDSLSQDVYFRKNYLRLGAGISGYIYSSTATGEGYGDKTDDGKTIILYKNSDKIGNKATTGKENPTTDSAPTNHGKFVGLGANAKLELLELTYSDASSYVSDPIKLTLKWADGSPIDDVQFTSEDTDFQYYKGI